MFMVLSLLNMFSYTTVQDLNPKYSILYTIAFISLLITMLFTIIMGRRTEYGESMKKRIKIFKNYLESAYKEQLENSVKDNPTYFYEILPYTYVLGISSTWVKKFENIEIRDNYMGNFNLFDMTDLIRDLDIYTSPSASSSSGGCSSCGGGCSSCGGGGSW